MVRRLTEARGGSRSVSATAWRDRLFSCRSAFGVARLGATTRLDDLGIETATAIRADPLGQSVSVCSGKGLTTAEAEAGALGEALERYCGEFRSTSPEVYTARRNELPGRSLDLRSFPHGDWVGDSLIDGLLDWCEGTRIHDAAPIFVPAELVFFPYEPLTRRQLLVAPTTTGLAAAASRLESILYGALECVERDAYSRAVALVQSGQGDVVPGIATDAWPASVRERVAYLEARGFHVRFRNLTHDLGIPTALAVLDDGTLAHFGCSSHGRAAVAIEGALVEAAQSRITDLQGAREDLPERSGPPHEWFTSAPPACAGMSDLACADSLEDELGLLDARLTAAGVGPVIAIDLSIAAVPAAVCRVIVAGLEQWGLDPTRRGSRAREWLAPSRS